MLSEALWAHRVSKHRATKVSPFELVYGQEAILHVEITLDACKVARQNDLSVSEYHDLMMDSIDEVTEARLLALKEIEKDKLDVAKAYNKKVKAKTFQVGDLVWKTVLPLKTKDRRFGKWSPSWEGPFRVTRVVPGNAYMLEYLDGEGLPKALNGCFLKRYYPSVWQNT